jgi:pimeloyl-ACP methyl ester carboxylesterase
MLGKPLIYIAVLLVTLLLAIILLIPLAVKYPDKIPLSRTPAAFGLSYEEVALQPADVELELKGWWMPAKEPRSLLVFIHGGSSNRDSSFFKGLEFYAAMVGNQVSVLAIDLRNHGESASDSQGVSFGLREKADASAAIRWAQTVADGLPVYAMGISMGGAALIYTLADGVDINGLILLDPLLDTRSAFASAVYADSGLPVGWAFPAALSAEYIFGFPGQHQQPLTAASQLQIPVLLIQDPGDPVTHAIYARRLAAQNSQVRLWEAPEVAAGSPALQNTGRWGSHVSAYHLYPAQTLGQITRFMGLF